MTMTGSMHITRIFKKTNLMKFMAISLILAPIGNVAMALFMMGVEGWYLPRVFLAWALKITTLDQIWLSLVVVAGFTLLRAHIITWIFSALILLGVVGVNFYYSTMGINPALSPLTHLVVGLLGTGIIGTILFHCRYPYLDRREGLFLKRERFSAGWDATLVSHDNIVIRVTDVSRSGIRLESPAKSQEFNELEIGDRVAVNIPEKSVLLMGEVTRIFKDGVGVAFRWLNEKQKTKLMAAIESLKKKD